MPIPTFADFYSVVGWPFWLMLVGGLLSTAAGLWLIVAAFRESVLWGVCVLLVPFAALVFVFMKWRVAAKPFLLSLLAICLMFAGFVMAAQNMQPESPAMIALAEKYGIIEEQMRGMGVPGGTDSGAIPEPTPTQILSPQELMSLQRELNEISADLLSRKQVLAPGDAKAAAQLTADIKAYNERLEEFKQLRSIARQASQTPAQTPDDFKPSKPEPEQELPPES